MHVFVLRFEREYNDFLFSLAFSKQLKYLLSQQKGTKRMAQSSTDHFFIGTKKKYKHTNDPQTTGDPSGWGLGVSL